MGSQQTNTMNTTSKDDQNSQSLWTLPLHFESEGSISLGDSMTSIIRKRKLDDSLTFSLDGSMSKKLRISLENIFQGSFQEDDESSSRHEDLGVSTKGETEVGPQVPLKAVPDDEEGRSSLDRLISQFIEVVESDSKARPSLIRVSSQPGPFRFDRNNNLVNMATDFAAPPGKEDPIHKSIPASPTRNMDAKPIESTSSIPSHSLPRLVSSCSKQPSFRGRTISAHVPCDEKALSVYQSLIRQQIEFFEAGPTDIESTVQGRNKQIILGQVGIRCIHCKHLPTKQRKRGATYFPTAPDGIYQTAQNMARCHFATQCEHIPEEIRQELKELRQAKTLARGGKQYWADSACVLGITAGDGILMFDDSVKAGKKSGSSEEGPSGGIHVMH